MRVADLDLYNCPPGLRSQLIQGIKTCIKSEYREGCTPVLFSTFGISYSKVCGTITGYGVNTPDGFKDSRIIPQRTTNLNNNYVDGISVQSGADHVWTYVAGQCDCTASKPAFIGDDWTCDGRDCTSGSFCDGPLWDTPICGSSNPFFKEVTTPTTAEITHCCRQHIHPHNGCSRSLRTQGSCSPPDSLLYRCTARCPSIWDPILCRHWVQYRTSRPHCSPTF